MSPGLSSRHLDQRLRSQRMVLQGIVCLVVAVLVPSCALNFQDREYAAKMAAARSDFRGDEIVGVWVSKVTNIGSAKFTVLFRPGGTGRERSVHTIVDGSGGGSEWTFLWRYAGNGEWQGSHYRLAKGSWMAGTASNMKTTFRHTDRELLCQKTFDSPMGVQKHSSIYIRADDEAAVEEHLKKR
jgi:hypothetical protein